MQGFINHCRYKHDREFPSHSEATRACGVVVGEEEVPLDHAARRIHVKGTTLEKPTSFIWGVAPQQPMSEDEDDIEIPIPQALITKERPKIKVYEDEAIDIDVGDPMVSQSELSTAHLPSESIANSLKHSELADTEEDSAFEPVGDPMLVDTMDPAAPGIDGELRKNMMDEESSLSVPEAKPDDETPDSVPSVFTRPTVEPSVLSTGTGSRFYVKRRVVLGNVSRFIPVDKREPGMAKYAFKWMIYLHGPAKALDITPYVHKVRFYLHPDYKPFDIIEVTDPPFRLTRYGWGEFPVRVQLVFRDERNKNVDLIHHVKLDHAHTGRQVPGPERFLDLELDRNTEFGEGREKIAGQTSEDPVAPEEDDKGCVTLDNALDPDGKEHKARKAKLDRVIKKAVDKFPLIRPNPVPTAHPLGYTTAPTVAVYLSWPIGKRKASERARQVLSSLRESEPSLFLNPTETTVGSIAASPASPLPAPSSVTVEGSSQAKISKPAIAVVDPPLSLKYIVAWCASRNHTPAVPAPKQAPAPAQAQHDAPARKKYCRFCGGFGAHEVAGQEDAEKDEAQHCPRRPGMWRGRVWTLTSAHEVAERVGINLATLDGSIGNEDELHDINVDSLQQQSSNLQTADIQNASWSRRLLHPTASANEIEWVTRTVRQLRLPSLGTDPVACGILFEATRSFLMRILEQAIVAFRADQRVDAAAMARLRDNGGTSQSGPDHDRPPKPNASDTGHAGDLDTVQTSEHEVKVKLEPFLEARDKDTRIKMHEDATTTLPEERPRLLVPYHVYRGIVDAPERTGLDFLTGDGLAGNGAEDM
ncbi:YEATS domain-containing protein 2 [Thoreauomyces humboldtii]|nr:YEATS domain-containing protein 2 [Thoreauomyces humboldtii]